MASASFSILLNVSNLISVSGATGGRVLCSSVNGHSVDTSVAAAPSSKARSPRYQTEILRLYHNFRFSDSKARFFLYIGHFSCIFSNRMILNRLVARGCRLVGCGSAVPAFSISNDELAKYMDTSDEWISSRTGIRRRRILTGRIFEILLELGQS